jgi:hypothetical protein
VSGRRPWPRSVAHVARLARGLGLRPDHGAEGHVYFLCPACSDGRTWASAHPSVCGAQYVVLDCKAGRGAGRHDLDELADLLLAGEYGTAEIEAAAARLLRLVAARAGS